MKIGIVYTSTTPELIELVEREVKNNLGAETEILSYQDPSILAEIRESGYVVKKPAARLISMYMQAVVDDVDVILNACSSVGEVADATQDIARYIGVPIVRIDEEMCKEAVRRGDKIAIMATLPTTLEPTKNTILRVARELGKHVELVDVIVEGAFGVDQATFKSMMLDSANAVKDQVEVILFAQGSMAYCEEYIQQETGKTTLSSPRFGAGMLKEVRRTKGL